MEYGSVSTEYRDAVARLASLASLARLASSASLAVLASVAAAVGQQDLTPALFRRTGSHRNHQEEAMRRLPPPWGVKMVRTKTTTKGGPAHIATAALTETLGTLHQETAALSQLVS